MFLADHRKLGKVSIEVSSMFISEILGFAHLFEPERFDRFIDYIRDRNSEIDNDWKEDALENKCVCGLRKDFVFKEYKGEKNER